MKSVEVYNLAKEYSTKDFSGAIGSNFIPLFDLYVAVARLVGSWKVGTVKALDGISFSVEKGEILGILGPNGSGKTTLLSILAGLTPLTKGEARVEGFDVVKDHDKLPEVMMYMPGPSIALIFSEYSFSVRDNLIRYAEILKVPKEKVDEVIALTELNEWATRRVSELSTGILARLAFAYGLLKESKVYFMDEPFSGISPEVRNHLLTFIKEVLSRKNDNTVLYATHRLDEANYLFDKVLILVNGRVMVLDTPKNLMKKLELKEHIDIEIKYNTEPVLISKSISEVEGVLNAQSSVDSNLYILKMKMTVEDSREVIPKIVDKLHQNRAKLLYVKVTEPTLEDVYMALVKSWKPPEPKPALTVCGEVFR
ncbi:MAG: ABC transporter ATP-binding protein [Thermoproteota archaeon]